MFIELTFCSRPPNQYFESKELIRKDLISGVEPGLCRGCYVLIQNSYYKTSIRRYVKEDYETVKKLLE